MRTILLALWLFGAMTSISHAGEVTVTWPDPTTFTDIRPANEMSGDLQERLVRELNQVFDDLARELPDGYKWSVAVTDVDLAGEVRPLFRWWSNEIRVVKASDWPRISFQYDLKDAQGHTVASAGEDVRDMGFLMHSGASIGRTSFRYEERMLRDWFHLQQRQTTFPVR